MTDLEIIYPAPTRVRVGNRLVHLRPIEFRDFEAFGKAASELLVVFGTGDMVKIYTWAKNAGALQAILHSCSDLSKWRIERLPVATAIELMYHVIALNSRFFDQALVSASQLLVGAKSSSD